MSDASIEDSFDLLDAAPPEVRQLFAYGYILALLDDERAWIVRTRREEGREWLTLRTVEGHVFEVLRPELSEAEEAELMEVVRASRAEE